MSTLGISREERKILHVALPSIKAKAISAQAPKLARSRKF